MSTKKKSNAARPVAKKNPTVPTFTVEPEVKPTHCVIGDEYVVQTDQGELRVSLRVRERVIMAMEDLPAREQFAILLAEQNPDWVEKMLELDSTDANILRTLFFIAYSQYQGARLGEALRSSD